MEGSNSIIITESASVIRQLNRIKDEIDLPPEETIQKAYQLERADATTVATAIIEMLGFGEGNERPRSAPPQAGEKNAAQGAFKKPVGKEIFGRSNSDAKQAGAQPVIRAIPRTNRIVVVARPVDQLLVEQLVDEFDAPAPMRRFFTTKLQFINVVDFLRSPRDAILRGMIEEGDVNSGQSTSGGVSQGRGRRTAGEESGRAKRVVVVGIQRFLEGSAWKNQTFLRVLFPSWWEKPFWSATRVSISSLFLVRQSISKRLRSSSRLSIGARARFTFRP